MKTKICIPLIMLLFPLLLMGQKKVPQEINRYKAAHSKFEKLSVLEDNKNASDSKSRKIVKTATFATLNANEIDRIVANRYQTIEIQIPYKASLIAIELYRVELFAEGFHADTDKQQNINYQKGVYYRGIVKGNENSIASFNFFENEMNGLVSSLELGNLNIGKLAIPLNVKDYIVYSDNDLLISPELTCHTDEKSLEANLPQANRQNMIAEKWVTCYFEIGYQAFEENGSNTTTSLNWMTSIFNNVQTLYNNDGILISFKSVFIWTTDDYYRLSSNYIIPAFSTIRPSFDGDIGFIADIDPAGLGGQAFGIATLCTDRKYAYGDLYLNFDAVPTYSKSVNITAHEIGHLLGSHHTHTCVWNGNNTAIDGCVASTGGCPTPTNPPDFQGTIMSYCANLIFMGFGEQPANAIISHINNSDCLGTDGVNTCISSIGKIEALNTTQNSVTIQWLDTNLSNAEWEYSIVPYGNAPVWTPTTISSFLIENLTPNTYYEITVKGDCGNGLAYPKHTRIFATQAANCDGVQIYDTGGPDAPYQIDEHVIRTIVPTVPDKKIKLTFNSVNLVLGDSELYVYDGPDNNGPLLNRLTSGYPLLGVPQNSSSSNVVIESQHATGALTLEFFSRTNFFNSTSNNGWTATVNCLNILGNEEFGDGFIDFAYSPNPVKGMLNIKSKDEIKEVSIYSIDGKLVFTEKTSGKNINIDLSSLSNDLYIAKLHFEKTESSFKIIKE